MNSNLGSKNRIERPIELDKIFLLWQPKQKEIPLIVGELTRKGSEVTFRYLKETPDYKKALELRFEGYPAFKIDNDEEYKIGVMDSFMVRLPPRTRGDFKKYLEIMRVAPEAKLNDFSLLGYSGGKLPSDRFSFVPSFEKENILNFEYLMEVVGFQGNIEKLKIGTQVLFKDEQETIEGQHPIGIYSEDKRIGYVNPVFWENFHNHLHKDLKLIVVIERINGTPDNPSVYLFIEAKKKIEKIAARP